MIFFFFYYIMKRVSNMKKIKLFISSYDLNYGGIEKSLVNLIKMLDKEKFEITLCLENLRGIYLNEIKDMVILKEYHPSNIKVGFIRKIVNLIKRFIFILKSKNKYDVSICYATYSLPSVFTSLSAAKKRIYYVHSNYVMAFNNDKNLIYNFFDERKINKFDKIIFVSNEAKNDLALYYKDIANKSVTINNLINVSEVIDNAGSSNESKNICLYVGRMDEKVKRISIILDLAKKCQEDGDDLEFWLVGDGIDLESLKNKANNMSLTNVTFWGSNKNPYKFIKASSFVILTSKYEGFPQVYNEAILLEKPILTTIDVSDEFISINNRFGIVSKEKDLYKNLAKIKKFKPEKINFNTINKKRIKNIERIISDLHEE